jgi:hypothetical protein
MSSSSPLSSATSSPKLPQLPSIQSNPSTLPLTNAYIITQGLFRRTALMTVPASVQYTCTQPECKYQTIMPSQKLTSTGNLLKHYHGRHKGIPTSHSDAKAQKAQQTKAEAPQPSFFRKYNTGTGLSPEQYRKLLLNMIVKNNLPLSLTDSPSFRELVDALNPLVSYIYLIGFNS